MERISELRKQGKLNELLHKAMNIQNSLETIPPSRVIGKSLLMHKGNVNAAIKLLTMNMQNGILPINEDTLDLLKQKHLKGEPAHESVLPTDTPEETQPIKFESIQAECIQKAAIKTKGRSEPSGVDADV